MYGLVQFGTRFGVHFVFGSGWSAVWLDSVFGFVSGFASVYACDKVSGVPWCIIIHHHDNMSV